MKRIIITVLALSSWYMHASESIFALGQWIQENKNTCLATGACIGAINGCIGCCTKLACSLPNYRDGLTGTIFTSLKTIACEGSAPIMESSPYVAGAAILTPIVAVGSTYASKIPRDTRRKLVTEFTQNCAACSILAACNALLGEYARHLYGPDMISSSATIDLSTGFAKTITNACNAFCPVYGAYAEYISLGCMAIPPLLYCVAKVGDCCAGDADKED